MSLEFVFLAIVTILIAYGGFLPLSIKVKRSMAKEIEEAIEKRKPEERDKYRRSLVTKLRIVYFMLRYLVMLPSIVVAIICIVITIGGCLEGESYAIGYGLMAVLLLPLIIFFKRFIATIKRWILDNINNK